MLDIRGLSINYRPEVGSDVRAVRNVDLALNPGKIVGLAGESGCGKSTLALRSRAAAASAGDRDGRAASSTTAAGSAPSIPTDSTCWRPTTRGLKQIRWREIAIVFQSAMNALNPVIRIEDQITDGILAHMPVSQPSRLTIAPSS